MPYARFKNEVIADWSVENITAELTLNRILLDNSVWPKEKSTNI
jgi:hypothetical protein